MSYIRLGFRPRSSAKSGALEKDTPPRWRRNRNISAARAIWRVVSLNYRGFAAFLQHDIEQQPEPRSSRAPSTDGAGSCGVGREDHDRFDERPPRRVVRRRVVLDRGGLPHCGASSLSRPRENSAGNGAVCNAVDARGRIKRCSRDKTVVPHNPSHFTEPSTITSINFAPGRANADLSVEATSPALVT
jgi:hypothetical protein